MWLLYSNHIGCGKAVGMTKLFLSIALCMVILMLVVHGKDPVVNNLLVRMGGRVH